MEKKLKQFVGIDSEGVSFGPIAECDGAAFQKHRTIFWGACGEKGEPDWLVPGPWDEHRACLRDEPYCTSLDILEWLVSLADKFPDSIFVWFGSSYDATQALADLPYEKAWEVQNGKPWKDRLNASPGRAGRYVFYDRFAISYFKGKYLRVGELCVPERPYYKGKLYLHRSITIYDVFGFFQCSFLKAAASVPGAMMDHEKVIIEEGKRRRAEFSVDQISMMKRYTTCELHVLARMMESVRASVERLGIKILRWQGAGSIAAAMMKRHNCKEHYHAISGAESEMTVEQQWAHRAFFGGRIEMLKQGACHKKLHSYDIRSAYPAALVQLPSMRGGHFEYRKHFDPCKFGFVSDLSMFDVEMKIAVGPDNTICGYPGPAFYPLPYRDYRGCITFPPHVRGIYMKFEAMAAYDWFLTNVLAIKRLVGESFEAYFRINGAMIFHEACDEKPFAFVADAYNRRRDILRKIKDTGKYDLTEKIYKLGYNSIYGKTAQSVGNLGKVPGTVNPWYAAAITAKIRACLVYLAMRSPQSIVSFQTDGIVSEKHLLVVEGDELGQWEHAVIEPPSYFIQPGIYSMNEKSSKHRGINLQMLEQDNFREWIEREILPAWRSGVSRVQYPYRCYMTVGLATVTEEKWKFAGYWGAGERELELDQVGFKRVVPMSTKIRRSRVKKLVDCVPLHAYFYYPFPSTSSGQVDELPLSEPRLPAWLDTDLGLRVEEESAMEEIITSREL